jgi:hypothetical protein
MPIDYSKYPPNWKTEIRPRIMKRAKNCCEKCGLEHRSFVHAIKLWVRDGSRYKYRTLWFRNVQDAVREDMHTTAKPVKVVLTIAHLDHDEENHNVKDERLRAWCQLCHLRYDAKEKYRRANLKSNR